MSPVPHRPLDLVLLWHMHQPDYRDRTTGEHVAPWAYLHALKDYTDMAAHLERHSRIAAVVNFVPVLLDQLEALAADLARAGDALANGAAQRVVDGAFKEQRLRLLAAPDLGQVSVEDRRFLLEEGFRCNHPTMLAPFAPFMRLWRIREALTDHGEDAVHYLGGHYFADLVTWFHLAWTGESVRRDHPLVRTLMAKGAGFTHAERLALLALIGELLAQLPGRYRALMERGQIELSTTPYAHPLGPLMIDFGSARESTPRAPLPDAPGYPDGEARLSRHVADAIARHAEIFGRSPAGMWPAEGALSEATIAILARAGLRWAASAQSVLANSLALEPAARRAPARYLHRPYRLDGARGIAVFFRDDELSDLIGFEYARWHGKEAAQDLVARLERRVHEIPDALARPVVLVALDGENAWEHYPYNGFYFFEELYTLLEHHPVIRTTTFERHLADGPDGAATLARLVAGSWVHGTLATWIGDASKNRAWDRLCAAKRAFDRAATDARWSEEQARVLEEQLRACEGSDWFWWLEEGAAGQGTIAFDRLFRLQLANLYRLIDVTVPADLAAPAAPIEEVPDNIGAMRRSH